MSGACPVVELWRYPVKSMAGEPLTQLRLGPDGVEGDRTFALIDARTGKILTAKRAPQLLQASTRWLGEAVEIILPEAAPVHSDDPAASRLLSAWLGQTVRLDRSAARAATVEYEIDSRDPTALAEFALLPGTFVDEAPLHILSDGSLRAARAWHPDGAWQVRRFRPNIVLGTPLAEPVEDGWAGRHVRLGEAVVEVTGPCRRCVMVSHAQGELAKDSGILRSLTRQHRVGFGVYADIIRTGVVWVADVAEQLLPAAVIESSGGA